LPGVLLLGEKRGDKSVRQSLLPGEISAMRFLFLLKKVRKSPD
jgi:hypothetical protein